ncbi:putative FG-GAP repeat protein [Trypanosoma theileri]|uniref:Putative FG-GAP repeat protein n=1 Tax=Trypanosoma theileri TaxID=67003 RepID=A0A1X0NQP9_9TRYP|nr:putative FG-GAP repeat protein [Trypanosoma theileri]ORC87017.1 putative FG-GAP repeat protein [Trypanosoma theileri]
MGKMICIIIFLFIYALNLLTILSGVNAEWVNETTAYMGSSPVTLRITSVGDWNNLMETGFFGTMGNHRNLLWYCRHPDAKSIYHLCWKSLDFPSPIISTIVVDLNRDGVMDILVQCQDEVLRFIDGKNRSKAPISINNGSNIPNFNANIPQMSLVSVFNSCGLPDIAMVDKNGSLVIMRATTEVSGSNCIGKDVIPTFDQFILVEGEKGVREVVPLSIISDDINGDCAVDLIYSIHNIDKNTLEVYVFFTSQNRHELLMTLKPANRYGSPTVVDINGDGAPDIIFPLCAKEENIDSFGNCSGFNGLTVFYNLLEGSSSCSNAKCCNGHPYGFSEKVSKTFFLDLNNVCGIHTVSGLPLLMPNSLDSPLELRFGDYNRDGYNDLLIPSTYGPLLLTTKSNSDTLPFSCTPLNSELAHDPSSGNHQMYIQAVPFFVVISDRGRLDIILTYHGKNSLAITVYTNHISSLEQNYFLTASALNGVGQIDTWGLYQPGAVHRFRWSDIAMNHRWGYGVQLSKSQGHALQSPRLFFGLGRTFSYVEDYTVAVLVDRESVHHQWSENLIPNSNLFIWLSPFVSSSQWRLRLYIASSTYQMLLFVVLITTLVLIGIPILFLKWREVQQDRREWRFR